MIGGRAEVVPGGRAGLNRIAIVRRGPDGAIASARILAPAPPEPAPLADVPGAYWHDDAEIAESVDAFLARVRAEAGRDFPVVIDPGATPPTMEAVRARREALGIGQAALARAMGMTRGPIASWEQGRRPGAPGMAERAMEAIDGIVARMIERVERPALDPIPDAPG